MPETSDKATRARWLLQAAIGVGCLAIVHLALRGSSFDDPTVAEPGASSTEAEPARAPPSSAPEARVATGLSKTGSSAPPITSGADMTQLLLEAKAVEAARSALASGEPERALEELRLYEERRAGEALRQEATLLRIEALMLVGRKADALALAEATRTDPSFDSYQGRIGMLLQSGADAAR